MKPRKLVRIVPALLVALALAAPAQADVELADVFWEVIGGTVEFHVIFCNTDPSLGSGPVDYELWSQPYGAFVPSSALICSGTIPDIPAGECHEVICIADIGDLPPSAEVILPGTTPDAPGINGLGSSPCPPLSVWNGNVDVIWTPGTAPHVGVHFGTMYICPGGGPSYIHILMDCTDPAGITWSFSSTCPSGVTPGLVFDAGGVPGAPVPPGPIPPGFFDGWICVTADATVPVGTMCYIDLDVVCAGVPVKITVCVEACDWAGPTPVESTTWGEIKLQNLNPPN